MGPCFSLNCRNERLETPSRAQNQLDNMSGRRPRRKLVPPVETTTVRGPQNPKRFLVQSVHFSHLDKDGRVTTNSVLDLATRPYSSAAFFPDIDITESLNDNAGAFDSLDTKAFDSLTNENTSDTTSADTASTDAASAEALQNETLAEVVSGFFEIDPEDQVTNVHTGEKKAPKRPHQVCCTLGPQWYPSDCPNRGEIYYESS